MSDDKTTTTVAPNRIELLEDEIRTMASEIMEALETLCPESPTPEQVKARAAIAQYVGYMEGTIMGLCWWAPREEGK